MTDDEHNRISLNELERYTELIGLPAPTAQYARDQARLRGYLVDSVPVLLAIAKAALDRQSAIDRDATPEAVARCEKALLEAVRKVAR